MRERNKTREKEGQRVEKMVRRNPLLLLSLFFFSVSTSISAELKASPSDHGTSGSNGGFRRRVLLGFKETPSGSNTTFDCAPSGACVPCQYSEKSEPKYRCSETGYRIPLKCVEIKDGVKLEKQGKFKKNRSDLDTSDESRNQETSSTEGRNLAEDSKKQDGSGSQAYITYRSCIPPVDEEKVSVLGFEGIVLFFMVASGSFVYYRKKQTGTMPGADAYNVGILDLFVVSFGLA
ncbi:unnamed protein product [Linum tenue]|uniref:Uncharacterized protein n=1 Tax=Linum tenue TaxID=586396 RepID=A0AAV0HN57_9ROSI|nr:unnamed protein product [Linum tenue]